MVDIDRLRAELVDVCEELRRSHARRVVLEVTKTFGLEELRDHRFEAEIQLVIHAIDAQIERLEELLVADFFFMFASMRLPFTLAVLSFTSGFI